MTMPTYQARDPLARANTLRSIPLIRSVHEVFGHTEQFQADWALQIARRDVGIYEQGLAHCYVVLGQANKVRGPMRRHWQAKAFRNINSTRVSLRAARKALIVAEAAMLAFAPAVAA
jgi:hypothetical protein